MWDLWKKTHNFLISALSKLCMMYLQIPLLHLFLCFVHNPHFGHTNSFLSFMLQFVSHFCAGGHFKAVYFTIVVGKYLFYMQFSVKLKQEPWIRFHWWLFYKNCGWNSGFGEFWHWPAVPGIHLEDLLWWTSFSAQIKFSVAPLILMADTSKGSTGM